MPFLNYGKRSLEMFWKKLFQISNLHFCLLQLCKTVKSSFFFTVIMQNVNHLSQWKMSRLISSISIQIHFLLLKILNIEMKWNLSNFANSFMSQQISKSNEYVWTVLSKISIKLKDYFLSQIKNLVLVEKKKRSPMPFLLVSLITTQKNKVTE